MAMSGWWWRCRQASRKLWVRTTCIGLLGFLAALVATVVEHWLPWTLPAFVPVTAIESLLTIIASSMLAVSTFSLNIMTGAYSAASNSVTPRATKLLMEDTMTQTVLASFVGAFIFSIVGMILLRFGVYGDHGRVVLFIVTIAVLAMIVINLLRWINYLTTFGRMGDTITRVEAATKAAMQERLKAPYLGGQCWPSKQSAPPQAQPVCAQCVGNLQHIDMQALAQWAQQWQAQIYIDTLPGKAIFMDTPLAWVACAEAGGSAWSAQEWQARSAEVRDAFLIVHERNFDQDPRFGMVVLCEIGSRALSPATNDPGTALNIIACATRLLSQWAIKHSEVQQLASEVDYPALHVRPLCAHDLLDDAFMLLARDGAHLIEVQLHLQKSLAALMRLGDADFRAAAQQQAELALLRAQQSLVLAYDRQRLHSLVQRLGHLPHCQGLLSPAPEQAQGA